LIGACKKITLILLTSDYATQFSWAGKRTALFLVKLSCISVYCFLHRVLSVPLFCSDLTPSSPFWLVNSCHYIFFNLLFWLKLGKLYSYQDILHSSTSPTASATPPSSVPAAGALQGETSTSEPHHRWGHNRLWTRRRWADGGEDMIRRWRCLLIKVLMLIEHFVSADIHG
jgi:hypothetical protein